MPPSPYLTQWHDMAVPLTIAGLIVLFSLTCFGVWSQRIRIARRAVLSVNNQLRGNAGGSREALQQAHAGTHDKDIQFLLRETEAGLIELPLSQQPNSPRQSYSFRSHADTWTVRSVLGARMNLALFETMPNLLIGFGLMCTFVFLAVALQQAGLALNAMDASSHQQDQALQSLIATAGGKFITSIAGLLCSLLWNWRAKVALETLQSAIDNLCHTLRSRVPDNAAEASMRLQLTLFQDILQENRAQVSELRRFESHFAHAIGDALSRQMPPGGQQLDTLHTLVASINALTQGVAQYSSQVAELHTQMDQHLASAIHQLGGSIANLEEVLDEFIESLPSKT